MPLNAADLAAKVARKVAKAGNRLRTISRPAARCMAVGKMSFEDCPKLTSSFGCTVRFSPRWPPNNSDSRLARTSFMFIWVCVPEPVCQMDSGNSKLCLPCKISRAAVTMASALCEGNKPRSRLTRAQAAFTLARAKINSMGICSVEM